MRIGTKLKINPALIVIFAVVLGAILSLMHAELTEIREKDRVTNEVARGVGELNILTYDYLNHPSERSRQQWLEKQASLAGLAASVVVDRVNQEHLERIVQRLKEVQPLFAEIAALEDGGAAKELNRQLRDRLVNNLLMTSQAIISDSNRMNEAYHDLGIELQKRLIYGIMLTTMLLAILMTGIAASINRGVMQSIQALRQAAGILGTGQFGHRIAPTGEDEISELGESFNMMAERIEASLSEKALLEDQLHQSQKMEAIGTLAGGVAHDFNNILTAIVGYATLAAVQLPEDSPARGNLDQIVAASERAAGLTRSLLAFSRKETAELRPQDLNLVVAGFQKMLHRLIDEDIGLSFAPAAGELVVNADKGQIEQVLMNLVTNARDAMLQGGEVRIATGRQRVEPEGDDLPAGDYATITVADNGSGMDQETLKRIFEPFYTTKPVGQGTGLGLSIVYGVVKKHLGAIRVESRVGKGTTFSVYLPLNEAKEAALAKAEEIPVPGGSETLLLIEDDRAVRDAVSQILEQAGYRVLSAGDGEDGVARFREHKETIDLVLSDLLMPKQTGLEVLAAMRQEKREVRVIFMSGYTADILNRRGIDEEGLTLLRKPLNPGDLLRKIREVLAA